MDESPAAAAVAAVAAVAVPPSPPPPPSPPAPPQSPGCRVTVFSTIHLVDAIANQEPEVCLASGYYPLEAQLDLTRSIRLTAVVPGGVRIDAQGSEAVPRRVMRVWGGATVVLTGLVLTGGVAPEDWQMAAASTTAASWLDRCDQSRNWSTSGGGLYNSGNVTISGGSIVANNTASQNGGGLYNESAAT